MGTSWVVIGLFCLSQAFCLLFSVLALRQSAKKFTSARLNARIRSLEAEHNDLNSTLEKILTTEKKLLQRLNAREQRGKQSTEPEPTSPEEWKKQMRIKIANGQLGVTNGG